MNHCLSGFRGLRIRDAAVFATLVFVVGLPFLWVQSYLYGPSDRLLSLLTSHFSFSAAALTAIMMALYTLLLGVVLVTGDRLRRLLLPHWNKPAQ